LCGKQGCAKSTKTRPVFGGSAQFLHEFLLLEGAMTSEDVMAASLNIIRGWGILKKQEFVQKFRESAKNRPRFCSSVNEFLYIPKPFMDDMNSEDVHKSCHDLKKMCRK
jgi:hypothetical protein